MKRTRNKQLKIGNVELDNPFLLAPLAGITDAPTRRICKAQGAALVYTEMVSAKGLWYGDRKTEKLLKVYPDEMPVAYQLFGSEPKIMAHAADELKDRPNVIFDINMGCPVPKVVKNGEGSSLMKKPHLVYDIVKACVDASGGKPVTAKIRAGWDDASVNAVEIAGQIEAAGGAAVAVHGRTREQFYSGEADWSVIKAVKEAVNIPVIGNGDIFSGEDAMRMMDETGCDMVMIARGSLGNPWIFREALALWEGRPVPEKPTLEEKIEMMIYHLNSLAEEKGEYVAVREMRKHASWYLKGVRGSAAVRRNLNTIDDISVMIVEFKKLLP